MTRVTEYLFFKEGDIMELLGIQDIANLYGWSRQRVYNYYTREQMPKPYTLVGGKRPVWTREQIESWKAGE